MGQPEHSDKLTDTSIVFFVVHPNHIKHLRPIYERLKDMGEKPLVFYFSTHCREILDRYGIDGRPIESVTGKSDYRKSLIKQFRLLLLNALTVFSKQERSKNNRLILKFFPSYNLIKLATDQITTATKGAKWVLFKAEGYQARAVLEILNERGVDSFAVQHGLINVSSDFQDLRIGKYLVWSEYFGSNLDKSGSNCDTEIVGNVVYDPIFKQLETSASRKRENKETFKILLLPNSGHSHTPARQVQLAVDCVANYAMKREQDVVVVKPHPGDVNHFVSRYYSEKYAQHGSDCLKFMDKDDPIKFRDYDLVVINNSAAGMESAIWEVPMITLAEKREEIMVPQYLDEGIALFASSEDEFMERVTEVMNDYDRFQENCRNFTNKYLAHKGTATSQVLKCLGYDI